MTIPIVRGLIDRRVLVNYRIDPDVLSGLLPPPFRPQLVAGFAVGGICAIRLAHVRPRFLPSWAGLSSENAAHRFAVEWDLPDGNVASGVYIPRRHSNSWLNTLAGGRLFPGAHRHARFKVDDRGDACRIEIDGDDGEMRVRLDAKRASTLPPGSVFQSLEEVSDFFKKGSLGYSDSRRIGEFEGLELQSFNWSMTPLDVELIESSFFDDPRRFPPGTVQFDSALLMRRIEHEWRARPAITDGQLGVAPLPTCH